MSKSLTFGKGKTVSEVLGIDTKLTLALSASMRQHFSTGKSKKKTDVLKTYLQSKEFKNLKYNLSTPASYFVLGYVFSGVLNEYTQKQEAIARLEAFKKLIGV